MIVGAGPTGMTAALELVRFGIPVRLVEKTPEPATTSRAIGVQARTLELLEQRGLANQLVSLGNPAQGASVYGGGKRLFRLPFDRIDSKYHYLLFVSQAETEKILREALANAGVPIERNVSMIAFAQEERGGADDAVTAVLKHADGSLEQATFAYLIEAEGAHSTARATLGLKFEGKSLVENYALGDLYIDGDLPESDFHIFSSEHGFMGLFPMGNRRFRLIASNPLSEPSKNTEPSLEELQKIYDQRSAVPAQFRDMSWSSWFRINSRAIDHLSVGRVFLGGDSAHIHSPAGAQGMNTGIQDMVNLCWKLAMVIKGQAKPELLDTYTADRIPVIRNVLTKTEGLTDAIGSENMLFRSVFNHIAPWVVSLDVIQENSTERMSQLSLNYRESPLSKDAGHAGSLQAGDRVPDLPVSVLNREGTSEQNPHSARLFELLDPSAFTVFYIHVSDPAAMHAEVQHALGDYHRLMHGHQIAPSNGNEDVFRKHFGSEPSIVLVRPDAYIGFTGTAHAVPQLASYCAHWLCPEQAAPQEAAHA